MFKAASETSALIKRAPHSSDMVDSPFYTRFGTSMYEYYEENQKKGTRFAAAMRSWSQCQSYLLCLAFLSFRDSSNLHNTVDRQVTELRDGYPWESLTNGKVVDIGGGTGHISLALARVYLPPLPQPSNK